MQSSISQDEATMSEINEKLENFKMGSCAKSTRNDLSAGETIFSEESSRAVYEMGNMEFIELKQTSATIQRSSCLKHVPEGLNMCQCGVWLRPNQSTMERMRIAFAALQTPYFRTTAISSREKKSGHNPWETDHAKTMDARRGATKNSRKFYLKTGSMAERRDLPSFSIGARWVNYLDYISKVDISYDVPYNQRNRYENSLFMRGVDSHKQAGPRCQRPDKKSSANALVSIQREEGKRVPHIPMNVRTKQRDTLDPATTFRMVESQLEDVFLVIFILNMDKKPNMVELFILGPPMARMALLWMAKQRMAGPITTSTTPESRTD